MRKNLAFSLVLLMVVLSACQLFPSTQPSGSTPTVSIQATAAEATELPAATQTLEAATPSGAELTPTVEFEASGPATCQASPVVPEVPDELEKLVPSVSDSDWTYGPADARITFYIYSDYQCPYCAKLSPILEELQTAYPDELQVVYRQLPLEGIHPNAVLAAQAAEAAGLQDKYWKMHDLLFAKQSEWSGLSTEEFKTWLYDQAATIKLDPAQFTSDLTSDKIVQKVSTSEAAALDMGISSTPFIFINKFAYQYRTDKDSLLSVIKYFMLEATAYTSCPDMTVNAAKSYTATIKTEKGDIIIELYPDKAPMAVNTFIFLANEKWYDNSGFFRVIPGYLVQAGDPTGSGLGNPGFKYSNEVSPDLRFDKPGVMGMATSGDGMSGSQFFITYSAIPEFDGKYTIFGQVTSGMEVLESLRPRNPDQDQILLPADLMISVTIEEK